MRILIISSAIPYPTIDGGSQRIYNLMRRMSSKHEIWLAALQQTPDDAASIDHLKEFCKGVVTSRLSARHPLSHLPGLARFALKGIPLELKFLYSEELARKIWELAESVRFDIVQLDPSEMAMYLDALPQSNRSKKVLVFHNIAFQQYRRFAGVERNLARKLRAGLFGEMMRLWEPRYAGRFDHCITVSELDRRLLLTANPQLQVDVIPNGVDTHKHRPLQSPDSPSTLMFVGKMNYPPCSDAVVYFCREILPRIRQAERDVEVWIVGSEPPREVMQLNGDGVHVTGRVQDVVSYYSRSAICVVPLRSGGGTRLKILEAMALGRPVVSTSIGSEGLDVVDGEHLLIADDPDEFAEKTSRLLRDKALRERITVNARKLVVDHYDWDTLAGQLLEVFARIAG